MRTRYGITAWMAFADFFVMIAVLAIALYGVQRRKNIEIEEPVKDLAHALAVALKSRGIQAEFDEANSAVVLPEAVLFRSSRWEILSAERVDLISQALKDVAERWKGHERFVLVIRGHADARPHPGMTNLRLSHLRAQEMQKAFEARGVLAPVFQIAAQGVGEFAPLKDNCPEDQIRLRVVWSECAGRVYLSDEALKENRRIELRFGFFSGPADTSAGVSAARQR